MKNIIHILDSNKLHLTPAIISSFENHNFNFTQEYYVSFLGTKNKDKEKEVYDALKNSGIKIHYINSLAEYLKAFMRQDLVIMHGLISPFKKQFLLFTILYLTFKKKLGKSVFVAWGGGDFDANVFSLFDTIYLKIISQIYHVITLNHEDKLAYEKIYDKESSLIPYLGDYKNKLNDFEDSLQSKKILISHSGWRHNYHIEMMNLIKNKIPDDTEIICPLAYGDPDYINEVIEYGKKSFKKFTYFTDLKSREEYGNLLSTIDVYITGAKIQTGLFAINSCLANGAKIYCRENLYDSLRHCGFEINNVSSISSESLEEFSFFSAKDKVSNLTIFNDSYNNKSSIKEEWNKIFNI